MRKAPSSIVAVLAVCTAGCVMSGKPNKTLPATTAVAKPVPAPAPPAEPAAPLSIPQTQVELPRPQTVDPAALSSNEPPPQTENTGSQPVSAQTSGRGRPPASTTPAPKPEVQVTTAAPPATTTSTAAPTSPTEAPAPGPIQEIVSASEIKRLQDSANNRRREAQQILEQVAKRGPTPAEKDVITRINNDLNTSKEAENKNDMKLADAFADRALILAKTLINGK